MLDRLVGRSGLANPDRVVAPDEDAPSSAEGCQADSSPHVVTEHQECAGNRSVAAVKGQAIADSSHSVFSDAEIDLSTFGTVPGLDAVTGDCGTGVSG